MDKLAGTRQAAAARLDERTLHSLTCGIFADTRETQKYTEWRTSRPEEDLRLLVGAARLDGDKACLRYDPVGRNSKAVIANDTEPPARALQAGTAVIIIEETNKPKRRATSRALDISGGKDCHLGRRKTDEARYNTSCETFPHLYITSHKVPPHQTTEDVEAGHITFYRQAHA